MEANASKHASKCEHACVRVRACACASACAWRGGRFHGRPSDTRVQSKIHSLANLAAARATCQPAAAARRSQARRGAHPTQNREAWRGGASSGPRKPRQPSHEVQGKTHSPRI
jgi:hypothetical protein